MVLFVDLFVKFRVFGITLGTLARQWNLAIPVVGEKPRTLLSFDERGVRLVIDLKLAA